VLFVADKSDAEADFSANAVRLAAQLPPEYFASTIFRDEVSLPDARQSLTDAINAGQFLVNYDGHGSVNIWSGNAMTGELLNRDDVRDTWTNAARLPLAVMMNCLNGMFNGYFDEESLAETMLRSAGGAVAAWASSSVTPSAAQARVNEEFYRLVFRGVHATVGEAAAASKRVVTSADLRRSWIFFGDPAMRLSGLVTTTDPVAPVPMVPAEIASHPVSHVSTGPVPSQAAFVCSGTGPALTFRWEAALGGADWAAVPASLVQSSATSSTLTIPGDTAVHFGRYRCTVENGAGAMTSQSALYINAALVATPSSVRFVARPWQIASLASMPAQNVTVNVQGPSSAWTAAADQPWVTILGGQGTGPGTFGVRIDPATAPAGGGTATITLTEASVPFAVPIPVIFTVDGLSPAPPFGFLDIPRDGATVSGAIPVSGWALDDVGVDRVEVWRSCLPGEGPAEGCVAPPYGGPHLVYIGVGTFVAGARPDVEQLYAALPRAGRAGWGLMVLTNAFPRTAAGPSAFTLHAFAVDEEGLNSLIGSKNIVVDNDNASLPFGTIDTPTPGGTMTSRVLVNFGWAMAHAGACIDTASPAAYQVFIDGISRPMRLSGVGQNWFPGLYRPDLEAQFPGLCNSGNALAAYYIDAEELGLSVGLHTIAWAVTDNQGRTEGIGSRNFEVLYDGSNASGVADGSVAEASLASTRSARRTVRARTGFDDDPRWTVIKAGADGVRELSVPIGGRIVIDLGGEVAAGYQLVGDELRELPPGATFDAATGQFAWQPPVGFYGSFRLAFTMGSGRIDIATTVRQE
jgi:hypothetical protein